MWISFALVSSLLSAVIRAQEKALSARFGNYSLGFLTKFASALFMLPLLFLLPVADIWELPWRFWWPLLIIWTCLYPIQTYLLYRSIREGELSHVVPVMSLLPVFNIISSFLVLSEVPSLLAMVGIMLVVAGVYVLLTVPSHGGDTYNKPALLMVGATVSIAIGSTLDKVALGVSTPAQYGFVNTLGAAFVLFILAAFYSEVQDLRRMRDHALSLAAYGFIYAALYIAAMYALVLAPTSYSLAVRSGSFVFAALWGICVLGERMTRRKYIAFALFIIGMALLALG